MRGRIAVLMAVALVAPAPAVADPNIHNGHCAAMERLAVPMAELATVACLDELTTAGTVGSGHTVPADWSGLTSTALPVPTGVPGIQVDGYFPDTSTTNANHGWNHDAQFVLRLPDRWSGGLVVSGAPGNRRQYANDRAIGDWALAQGYAFAATDKGNTGVAFHHDGDRPADAIAEWHRRVTQLAVAAKVVVAQRYGRMPGKTVAAGVSNGGYLVRWQLERNAWLFDGGLDWEGTLWRDRGPNLFTVLPPALRAYPVYAAGGPPAEQAHQALLAAGLAPGSEFLWPFHHQAYWDLTQRIYREEVDPDFDGSLDAGVPFCASGTAHCDADYDYFSRPDEVRDAVERISLTGRIGKPLITIHGTLDTLLPITRDSDVYAQMIDASGRAGLHRYYRVEGGNHVDGLVDLFPGRLRPLAPCFRDVFDSLDTWLGTSRSTPFSEVAGPRPTSC